MKASTGIIISITAVLVTVLAGCSQPQSPTELAVEETVQIAFDRLEIERSTWRTLVVSASAKTTIPSDQIWDSWTRLEDWPLISSDFHQSTQWLGDPGWFQGARFEQVLSLGAPLGTVTGHETVVNVIPGRQVIWAAEDDSLKAFHIWRFLTMEDGTTLVINAEVFHGTSVGLIKPLVARSWRKKFSNVVDDVIAHVGKTS